MRFKIDEYLPVEAADLLKQAGVELLPLHRKY